MPVGAVGWHYSNSDTVACKLDLFVPAETFLGELTMLLITLIIIELYYFSAAN